MCELHNHDASPVQEHSHSEEAPAEGHSHTHGVAVVDESSAECPVMVGSFTDKEEAEANGLVRDYNGTRYYLCCAACGPLFDADPEKYVAAL